MNSANTVKPFVGPVELDGMLWKPAPGGTATFEEFVAARGIFHEVNADARWNPWVHDDRAAEFDAAMDVMEQWTRAEPNHRRLTTKQWDARMVRSSRRHRAEFDKAAQQREKESERYDAEREASRLALLEQEARLRVDLAELDGLRAKTIYPGMDDARRAAKVSADEAGIARTQAEIERLSEQTGDPEDVVDQWGRLPSYRRELTLMIFSACRSVEVRELRTEVPELAALLKGTTDKAERVEHRSKLRAAQQRLDTLLAISELTADDMCSECATPMARHGWTTPTTAGPCPAWPRTEERRQEFRKMFDDMVRASQPPAPPAPPRPEPLAVIPSGLPIAEVMTKLADLQETYPDAEVRRGNRNRWELWPRNSPSV